MIRPGVRRLFRLAFHRRADAVRDVDDEIRLHLDLRTDELMRSGMSREQAHAEAAWRFAGSADAREVLYETAATREAAVRKQELFESIAQDLRYVVRSLRRSPTFVVSVVLTLALGLGANAALFAILDRLFLQTPAGIGAPGDLRRLYNSRPRLSGAPDIFTRFSTPEIIELKAAMPAGVTLGGYSITQPIPFGTEDGAPKGVMSFVIGDYFAAAGVRMSAGRPFDSGEVREDAFTPLAIISAKLAAERFGSSLAAIGKPVDLNKHAYTIVGVAGEGFRGTDLDAVDAWVPMNTRGSWVNRDAKWYTNKGTLYIQALIRSRDPTGFAAAARTGTMVLRHAALPRVDTLATAIIGSIQEAMAPGSRASERGIATRLAAVALVILLIACANVTNLMLARALQRRREIGVRLALGVSRARLMRQLLTESTVLALLACVASLIVAFWTATALRGALLPTVVWGSPAIGWRAIGFAVATALVAGIVAGLVPALGASRPDVTKVLKGGAREGGQPRSRVRSALLVSQLALSCVLLAGAGLFVRSLREVQGVDIGFDRDRIAFAGLSYSSEQGKLETEVDLMLKDAIPQIERIPGVERVAFSENAPMYAFSFIDHFLPDRDSMPRIAGGATTTSFISPGFFATMGVRVLEGRDFSPDDRLGAEPVILVNQAFAKTVWPGEHAVDKCLILHKRTDPCRRVIGVVANSHFMGMIEQPSMQFYVPLAQEGDEGRSGLAGALEIRAMPGQVDAVAAQAKRVLAAIGKPQGITAVSRTLTEQLAPQFRTWKLGAALFSAAGLLALLVAAVGVYGTIAYSFSQRTHEIGVRIALGAQATNILGLVLKSSGTIAGIGIAIGLALTVWAGQFAKPLLFNTSPYDPGVLLLVTATLLVVALIASLVPALRAKKIDPLEALRAE